jgi:hypothetical protein
MRKKGMLGSRARWQIKRIYHFVGSMNAKSQLTQERQYSEVTKKGRPSGVMKKISGWQKTTEKLRQKKSSKISKLSQIPGR